VQPAHLGQAAWLPPVALLDPCLPPPPALAGQYLGMAGSRPFQTLFRYVHCFARRALTGLSVENSASLQKLLDLWRRAAMPWQQQPAGGPAREPHARGPSQPLREFAVHLPGLLHNIGHTAASQGGEQPKANEQGVASFSSDWRSHVLATLPLMTSLIPLLVEVTISRVQYSPQPLEPVRELLAVLKPIADSPELVELLKAVDASLAQFNSSLQPSSEAAYAEVLPFLHDQAIDWENAAQLSSPPHGVMLPASGSMFSVLPNSPACNIVLLLQIEKLVNLDGGRKLLTQLRETSSKIFPLNEIPEHPRSSSGAETWAPSRTELKKSSWEALQTESDKYKHDIRRPISSTEIPFLVHALLPLHDRFQLDLRCLADSRNLVAGLAFLFAAATTSGTAGGAVAALLLALMLAFNQQLETLPAQISASVKKVLG